MHNFIIRPPENMAACGSDEWRPTNDNPASIPAYAWDLSMRKPQVQLPYRTGGVAAYRFPAVAMSDTELVRGR